MLFYYEDIFIIGRMFYYREDKLNKEDIVYDVEDTLFLMSSHYPPIVFPISSNVFTDEEDKLNMEDIL